MNFKNVSLLVAMLSITNLAAAAPLSLRPQDLSAPAASTEAAEAVEFKLDQSVLKVDGTSGEKPQLILTGSSSSTSSNPPSRSTSAAPPRPASPPPPRPASPPPPTTSNPPDRRTGTASGFGDGSAGSRGSQPMGTVERKLPSPTEPTRPAGSPWSQPYDGVKIKPTTPVEKPTTPMVTRSAPEPTRPTTPAVTRSYSDRATQPSAIRQTQLKQGDSVPRSQLAKSARDPELKSAKIVGEPRVSTNGMNGKTISRTTDKGHELRTVERADGTKAYEHIKDKNGKILSTQHFDKNGKPTQIVSAHKDGNGTTKTILNPQTGKPAAKVETRTLPNGTKTTTLQTLNADGSRTVSRSNGSSERWEKVNGKVVRVESTKPTGNGGSVSEKRVVNQNGSISVQRTYVNNNSTTVINHNYNVHPYGAYGVGIHVYSPIYSPFYVHPFFYPVAPWPSPYIHPLSSWSYWGPSPVWHGYYGGWFTPYSTYTNPNQYLTDYLIADMLANRYASQNRVDQNIVNQQNQQIQNLEQRVAHEQEEVRALRSEIAELNDQTADSKEKRQTTAAPLTEAMKAQIASQVSSAMAAYKSKSPITLDSILDASKPEAVDMNHLFAVHEEIEASPIEFSYVRLTKDEDGDDVEVACQKSEADCQEKINFGEKCSLSEGDLIKIHRAPKVEEEYGMMKVATSADDDAEGCDPGQVVAIPHATLQEMLNELSIRIEQGMTKMAKDPKFADKAPKE